MSDQARVSKRLGQVIPPFTADTSTITRIKLGLETVFRGVLPILLVLLISLSIFVGYRVLKNLDAVWYYLKNRQTIAFTLTDQQAVQDPTIDSVLNQLSQPGQTLQQKLIQLAVAGYAQNSWSNQPVVLYDNKLRSKHHLTFEQRIETAIDLAYRIYNHFAPDTELNMYGVTTHELIYQKGLNVSDYPPLALKNALFEGRRYFPFALIASQATGIDPLRLLKIFEIETDFKETVVGRNTDQAINDDIGIAQNNLAVVPGLIRDILNPHSPVYSVFFEFLSPGADLETGAPLTWANYLTRLEGELNGTYNRQKNPTGKYYINCLKAPHISAFLAAYHIKRD